MSETNVMAFATAVRPTGAGMLNRLASMAMQNTRAASPTLFAAIFVVCTCIFVSIAAGLVPPMQNADEVNHFSRVDQLAHGGAIAVRFGAGLTGGMVDQGIDAVDLVLSAIRFHPKRKVTPSMLLTHPADWLRIIGNTLADPNLGWWSYARQFVGVLGWLDVLLPVLFYKLVWLPVVFGCAASRPALPCGFDRRRRAGIAAAILVCVFAIFLAEYLTWTPVGTLWVGGVQGRYFLPLAMFVPLVLPAGTAAGRWRAPRFALLPFPAAVIGIVLPVLYYRYYG